MLQGGGEFVVLLCTPFEVRTSRGVTELFPIYWPADFNRCIGCTQNRFFFYRKTQRILNPIILSSRERLGSKADDMTAIKTHQWFAGFDWGGVQSGEYVNQVIYWVLRSSHRYFLGKLLFAREVQNLICLVEICAWRERLDA